MYNEYSSNQDLGTLDAGETYKAKIRKKIFNSSQYNEIILTFKTPSGTEHTYPTKT
jgi:hypothetical protein